jgi:DASH complex subunit DAD2
MFYKQSAWRRVSSLCRRLPKALTDPGIVKIPKPKVEDEGQSTDSQKKAESETPLPQTLVRIPTEHAPMLQPEPSSGGIGSGD